MANPRVRPYLHFYPEDTGGRTLREARQAERWLKEVLNDLLTPMVRYKSHDFYIHEPVMLRNGDVCMPVRWFTRYENGHHVFYAKCWKMEVMVTDQGAGWRVWEHASYEVHIDQFLKNFVEFRQDAPRYGLPDPRNIMGMWPPYAECVIYRLTYAITQAS